MIDFYFLLLHKKNWFHYFYLVIHPCASNPCLSGYLCNIKNCSYSCSPKSRTTTTTKTANVCQNIPGYDATCNYFAAVNITNCNSTHIFLGGLAFPSACRFACKLCASEQIKVANTTPQASCVDSQVACKFWKSHCISLASLNPNPCRKSCGKCWF